MTCVVTLYTILPIILLAKLNAFTANIDFRIRNKCNKCSFAIIYVIIFAYQKLLKKLFFKSGYNPNLVTLICECTR